MPEHFEFGGGATATVLHPLVLGAMIVVVLLTFLLPRKYVVVPLFLSLLLIPSGQHLYVAGARFHVVRILVLFGGLRCA